MHSVLLLVCLLAETPAPIAYRAKPGEEIVVELYGAGQKETHIAESIVYRPDTRLLTIRWPKPQTGDATAMNTNLPFTWLLRKQRPRDFSQDTPGVASAMSSVNNGPWCTMIEGVQYQKRSFYREIDGWRVEVDAIWQEVKPAEGQKPRLRNWDGSLMEQEKKAEAEAER